MSPICTALDVVKCKEISDSLIMNLSAFFSVGVTAISDVNIGKWLPRLQSIDYR